MILAVILWCHYNAA